METGKSSEAVVAVVVVGVRYLSRTLGLDDPLFGEWTPPEGSLADSDLLTMPPPPPLSPDTAVVLLVEQFLPTRDLKHHQQMTSTSGDEGGST